MKAEIEFRVWSHKLKEMLYQTTPVHSNEETGQVVFSFPKINFGPFELMQFIGVFDPSGKKIYKGDVIDTPNGRGIVKEAEEGISGYCIDFIHPPDPMMEITGCRYWNKIIGNIYENPELLL
jgi:hypothetical protein